MSKILKAVAVILVFGGIVALIGSLGGFELELIAAGQLMLRVVLCLAAIYVGCFIGRYTLD